MREEVSSGMQLVAKMVTVFVDLYIGVESNYEFVHHFPFLNDSAFGTAVADLNHLN